ncbi:ATP synthase subunit b [Acrasis kona]|uniref:ATP synthase subunit b n=1 Tax=Acrasis kona TaxID=1008807 RepID=A0AAW2ZL89_9EUKA
MFFFAQSQQEVIDLQNCKSIPDRKMRPITRTTRMNHKCSSIDDPTKKCVLCELNVVKTIQDNKDSTSLADRHNYKMFHQNSRDVAKIEYFEKRRSDYVSQIGEIQINLMETTSKEDKRELQSSMNEAYADYQKLLQKMHNEANMSQDQKIKVYNKQKQLCAMSKQFHEEKKKITQLSQ